MFQIQFYIFGIIAIAGAVISLALWLRVKKLAKRVDVSDMPPSAFFLVFSVIFTLIGVLGLVICAIPFNAKYWTVNAESGTVQSVETQVMSGAESKYLSQQFVLRLDSVDGSIVSVDPRVMEVKEGDKVDMACTWQWVPNGRDIYNCIFR